MSSHSIQSKKKLHKKPFVVLIGGGVIVSLFIAQIVYASMLTTGGKDISHIEKETQQLKEKNEKLAEQIASASSLITITAKAHMLGYQTSSVIYLSADLPVAFEPSR